MIDFPELTPEHKERLKKHMAICEHIAKDWNCAQCIFKLSSCVDPFSEQTDFIYSLIQAKEKCIRECSHNNSKSSNQK